MAELDRQARDALPEVDFAVPDKRKLPIHDADHVKLAWTQVERTKDLSATERQAAKMRIKARGHLLGVDTTDWQLTSLVQFEAMALEMPEVADHPNRMPFKGILTRIDQPSDLPPDGANGKRTLIPKAVAEAAIPSLLGMAVDFTADFDGHDHQQKIGLITGAQIAGDAIEIEGFFYAKDFPEDCQRIRSEKGALGFSFEADARIHDSSADIWVLAHCVFTGAAVLYKELAAYTTTSLSAQAEKGKTNMEKEILETLQTMQAGFAAMGKDIAALNQDVAEIKAKGASLSDPIVDQVKPHVDALNAVATSMETAGVGTDAKAGHVGVLRRIAAHLAAEAVSGKVPNVYRDHDYLPDARVEAGANPSNADIDKLTQTVADLGTRLADLSAKAFEQAEPPQRATVTTEIQSLLAKAGLMDVAGSGQVTVEQIDRQLDAAGIKGTKAIEYKLKLREANLLNAPN